MKCTILLLCAIPVLAMSTLISSVTEMSPVDYGEDSLVTSLCPNVSNNMLQKGFSYGAQAYRYLVNNTASTTTTDITITQAFLLSLLHCLVNRDELSYSILAECSYHIEQLRSKHLGLWLREDFRFPVDDMILAMSTLDDIYSIENGSMKLPSHVLNIFSSLADVYGITLESKEHKNDLMHNLENAVVNNNTCEIIALATKGGNVNDSTKSGDRLIHLAVKTGSSSSIAALGYLKADLEVRNAVGATPIVEAIKIDCHECIKELLLAGAKVEKRLFKGNTYLHIAATAGKNKALLALLDEGLSPNRQNYLGETSLLLAVKAGNVRGVEILLQRGADPSLVSKSGKSPFQVAIQSENVYMFKTLINSGLLPDLHLGNGDSLVHLIVRSGNATEMLKVLKRRDVQVNVLNSDGLAPLHIATDPSIVRMLLKMGADVNFRTEKGETALHLASEKGSLKKVEALVQLGAGVDIQDSQGNTALMSAAKTSNSDIVTFLLNNGADPTLKSKTGQTVLHFAAEGGCADCVNILLDAGANVDESDNNGDTPVFSAIRNNSLPVLRLLLDNGADLGTNGENGWTPLIFAATNGQLEVVKLLIDKGAPLNYKVKGYTALSTAVYYNQAEVEEYLRSIGGTE